MLTTDEDHSYVPQDPIIDDWINVLQPVKATKRHKLIIKGVANY